MSLRNAGLGTKLGIGFGVVIVILVGVAGTYQYAVKSAIGGFEDLLAVDAAIAIEAGEAKTAMLQCRRNEKDFLLRKDKKYLGKLQGNVATIKEHARAIVDIAAGSGNEDIAAKGTRIIALAEEYSTAFSGLVKAWEAKGLKHTAGQQGKFRQVAHALAEDLKDHELDEVYVAMLLVRRYEKDYVRTGTDKYKTKFLAAVKTYESLLASNACDPGARAAQTQALAAYRGAFGRYLATEVEAEQAKVYNEMRTHAADIEKAIKSTHVPGAKALMLDIRKNEKDYLLRGDEKYVKKTHEAGGKLLAAFKNAGVLQKHVDAVTAKLGAYRNAFDALVAEDRKITALVAAMRATVHKIEPTVDAIHEHAVESADRAAEQTGADADTLAMTAMVLGIVGAVVGVLMAFFITRSITKPIHRIIAGLTSGATQTASASGQVSAASQSLAEGTSEQAAAIEETTASVEEMTSMIKQNASNADEAKTLAAAATGTADRGTEAMTRMSGAIDDIKSSADETAKIVKTIDEIAFQTNLLALNAAVEAARAGEAGKGFAVVAEEVRNLAQRSAQAAKDTAELIEGSVKNADNGVQISQEVGQSLGEIADGSRKVNDLVAEIAAASGEQSQGIEQINVAIGQMDQVTQSNAANAEESASASEELSAQAEELRSMVDDLGGLVGGSAASGGGFGASFQADPSRPAGSAVRESAPRTATASLPAPKGRAVKAEVAIPMGSGDADLSKF